MSSVRDGLPIQGLSQWYRESGFPHRKPGLLHRPCSRPATTTSEIGRAACDVEASALCADRCDITQPSSRITNTGSRVDAGQIPHWPHPGGGASSSATSTTAWSPTVGQVLATLSPPRPPPLPSLPAAVPRPQPCRVAAHPSPPRLPPPMAPSMNTPCRHGRSRPERLGGCEGQDNRRHPANKKTQG
jgi:hypothetical protein